MSKSFYIHASFHFENIWNVIVFLAYYYLEIIFIAIIFKIKFLDLLIILDNFHFQSFYLLWSTFYWLSIRFFSIYLKFKIEKFFGATNCTIYFSECMLCGFMCETRKREREKSLDWFNNFFRLKAFLVWTQLRHEWENPFSFYLFVLDFVKNFRKMANFSCLFLLR